MNLLIFATIVLLIIGFFNPQASLFWYPKQRTRAVSALIYGVLFVLLASFGTETSHKPTESPITPKSTAADATGPQMDAVSNPVTAVADDPVQIEEDRVTAKLKEKAAQDWPNDYTTQEFWVNQELEAYKYMLTIPSNSIKNQAERDWPYDYTTQKFWYNQQIEAKERLNTGN